MEVTNKSPLNQLNQNGVILDKEIVEPTSNDPIPINSFQQLFSVLGITSYNDNQKSFTFDGKLF